MKPRHHLLFSVIPMWVLFGLGLALFLILVLPKAYSAIRTAANQLAYVDVVNGAVKVSDGITDVNATVGLLSPGNGRTLLKTNQGSAILKLPDGSIVIMDSASTIEFNHPGENDGDKSYVFNLVKGKVLVINEKNNPIPTQLILGGDIAVRVFQATMGLEVTTSGSVQKKIDCLVGKCLVNGVYQLAPGQRATFSQVNSAQVTAGVLYDAWVSLGQTSKLNPSLLAIVMSIAPTLTQTLVNTNLPKTAEPAFSVLVNSSITLTSSLTSILIPTLTLTPIQTGGTLNATQIWLTSHPIWDRSSTPTKTNAAGPAKVIPTGMPTFTKTVTPSKTLFPTITWSPAPTQTSLPAVTEIPTDPPHVTSTPWFTPTSLPTDTRLPTDVPTLMSTPIPPSTFTPTQVPPSHTPKPKHKPSPTVIVPPDTALPTVIPIPTEPPPTDTQVPG